MSALVAKDAAEEDVTPSVDPTTNSEVANIIRRETASSSLGATLCCVA